MHPITVHSIRDILALLAEDKDFHDSESCLCNLLRMIRVAEHYQFRGASEDYPTEPDTVAPH